jgi:hypothetical protein
VEKQATEKTYRLGKAGQRMAYLLLVGATLVWIFALWTLKNTLKLGFRPQNIWPSLQNLARRILGAEGAQPLTAEEAIPAVVMVVLLIVVPLLIWNIIEELRASITVGEGGLTFRSLGIELTYPWEEVANLQPADDEAEEPLDELILHRSRLSEIRSPLARFLHWQAYGRYKLPLYGGLEDREALIAQIQPHLHPAEGATTASAEVTADNDEEASQEEAGEPVPTQPDQSAEETEGTESTRMEESTGAES